LNIKETEVEFVDETFVPSEKDAEKAMAFSQALASGVSPDSRLTLQGEGNVEAVEIPHAVVTVLTKVLSVMSEGKPFKLMSMDEELTNQQAADILNVSKSYLDQVLDSGDICHRKVPTTRFRMQHRIFGRTVEHLHRTGDQIGLVRAARPPL